MIKIKIMKKCIECKKSYRKCQSPRCLDCRNKRKLNLTKLRGRKHYMKNVKNNSKALTKKKIKANDYYKNNKDKVKSKRRFKYRIKQLNKKLHFKIISQDATHPKMNPEGVLSIYLFQKYIPYDMDVLFQMIIYFIIAHEYHFIFNNI